MGTSVGQARNIAPLERIGLFLCASARSPNVTCGRRVLQKAMAQQGTLRVGISGWRYTPWRGAFYPKDLPQRLELWYASRILPTIEINGSFYSLQRPEFYQQWYDDTPKDFLFAVKGPRFITHMKKLRDIEKPLANFFASGVFNLREKFGPILWQFPPNFGFKPEVLEPFLRLLPRTTSEALALARRRDFRLKGRACLKIDADRKLRHAIEIRHTSFENPEFIALLRKYDIGLVVAETAKRWPLMLDVTADFVYVRLHGDKELYKSGYSDRALTRWAKRIEAWRAGYTPVDAEHVTDASRPMARDVYVYFDNTDFKLRAPIDAQSLMRKLEMRPGEPPDWKRTHEPRTKAIKTREARREIRRRAERPSAGDRPSI